MTSEEFETVFNEGYTEGFGSGFLSGLALGALCVVAIGLFYLLVVR